MAALYQTAAVAPRSEGARAGSTSGGGEEISHLLRILDTRRRLHAAGDIHAVGAHLFNGPRDIRRVEAARQNRRPAQRRPSQQAPIKGFSASAERQGGRVDQERRYLVARGLLQRLWVGKPQRLDHRTAELPAKLRGLVPVKLDPPDT